MRPLSSRPMPAVSGRASTATSPAPPRRLPIPPTGTYTSTVHDACRQVTWGQFHWTATTPGSSSVGFQVAVADSPSGPWAFVGPDGLSSSFFQTSGTSMGQVPAGRYLRYQATFSGDGTVTWTYTWDEDNRLLQVGLPGRATVSRYERGGRRQEKETLTRACQWYGTSIMSDALRRLASPRLS